MEPDMEELLLEPTDWLADGEWMEPPDWLLDEWMDDSCPSTWYPPTIPTSKIKEKVYIYNLI